MKNFWVRFLICFCFLFFAATLLFPSLVKSQSFGFSGGVTGFVPIYTQAYITNHGGKVNTGFIPGFRLEANLIIPDANFPGSGFNGFGATFSAPVHDSAVVGGWINSQMTNWKATTITHYTNISFRFGYIIPQEWNDFLLIHVGWGMGYQGQKVKYTLANYDPSISTLEDPDINKQKMSEHHGEDAEEILVGAMYEFEKFSVFGQYSFRFSFGGSEKVNLKYANSIYVGIYYPLKKF